jgi:hypothetical protein
MRGQEGAREMRKQRTGRLVIIRGKGTANEQRIKTDIVVYRTRGGRWVSVPGAED